MNSYDKQYLNLVEEILNEGIESPCRTGNNTLVKLNKVLTHDLAEGFPILTFRQNNRNLRSVDFFRKVKSNLSYREYGII
jgi:thymidylate synthase